MESLVKQNKDANIINWMGLYQNNNQKIFGDYTCTMNWLLVQAQFFMLGNWDRYVNPERLHQELYNATLHFSTTYQPWIDEHTTSAIQVRIDRCEYPGLFVATRWSYINKGCPHKRYDARWHINSQDIRVVVRRTTSFRNQTVQWKLEGWTTAYAYEDSVRILNKRRF